ncbi:hypothetical protein J6590_066589 [Homalodisca vitripennis]|nr:hypothetical protein J6590_066589 [Homalodisca vitripennis]
MATDTMMRNMVQQRATGDKGRTTTWPLLSASSAWVEHTRLNVGGYSSGRELTDRCVQKRAASFITATTTTTQPAVACRSPGDVVVFGGALNGSHCYQLSH